MLLRRIYAINTKIAYRKTEPLQATAALYCKSPEIIHKKLTKMGYFQSRRMIYFSGMNKNHLRLLYLVVILGTGIAIALVGAAASNLSTRTETFASFHSNLERAVAPQIASPTPSEQAVSRVGSTDGIMVMGVLITAITLLPMLFTKSTWKK